MKIEEAIKRIEHEMQMNDVMCNSTGIEEDTTAYLEKLNEALGMGVEALVETQWISVADRLPEIGESVLVAREDFIDIWELRKQRHEGSEYWTSSNGLCSGELNAVTHWKPLPKAPEV